MRFFQRLIPFLTLFDVLIKEHLDTKSLFLDLLLPPQLQRLHLSTVGAVGDKWVFPAVCYTAGVPGHSPLSFIVYGEVTTC